MRGAISGLLVAGVAGAAMLTGSAAMAGPFDGLAGKWTGTGLLTYADGTRERLQCTATYEQSVSDSIKQTLLCKSDSYLFRIKAFYQSDASSLTGSWQETEMDVHGRLTGSVQDGRISGKLSGPGFEATVVVDTKGNKQTVLIDAPGQQRITQVAISVSR
jgi:hypothetical protein